jgi:hypothetical protein
VDVNDLIEIEAIKRVKYRYMRTLDQKLWDEMATCFTEDAVAAYSGGKYLQGARPSRVPDDTWGDVPIDAWCISPRSTHLAHDRDGTWAMDDVVVMTDWNLTIRGAAFYEDHTEGRRRVEDRVTGYKRSCGVMQNRPTSPASSSLPLWATGGVGDINVRLPHRRNRGDPPPPVDPPISGRGRGPADLQSGAGSSGMRTRPTTPPTVEELEAELEEVENHPQAKKSARRRRGRASRTGPDRPPDPRLIRQMSGRPELATTSGRGQQLADQRCCAARLEGPMHIVEDVDQLAPVPDDPAVEQPVEPRSGMLARVAVRRSRS